MSRIMKCLIGIHFACLQLACSPQTGQLPLAVEEPVVIADKNDTPAESPETPERPENTANPSPTEGEAADGKAADGKEAAAKAGTDATPAEPATDARATDPATDLAVATFGSGCFWCTEAVFLRVKGVTAVESGYAGGFVKNPTYEAVCSGETGHAEVCRITFDPDKVSYDELLKVFWMTHDPTTLNRQGADVGTQYRSVVFYHNQKQKQLATKYKQELDKSGAFPGPIVTEISPLKEYYKAEDYHQNYFARNPFQGYCQAIVRPKVEKFEKAFKDMLSNP